MRPMPPEDDDDDMAALGGLMAEGAAPVPGEEPAEAGATATPEVLVSELKAKIAELEAALAGL